MQKVMFGVDDPADYPQVRAAGCTVVWNGAPDFRGDTGLSFLVPPGVGWKPGVIGFILGDDIPISKLAQVEARAA